MLQVQSDGKLLITPDATSSATSMTHKLMATLTLCVILAPAAYFYLGVFALGLVLVLFAAVATALFLTSKQSKQVLCSGQFLVGRGELTHLSGAGQKAYDLDIAQCSLQVAAVERGGFGLIIKPKNEKSVLCQGMSEQEATAMKACLEGKRIGKRNAKIRMNSSLT